MKINFPLLACLAVFCFLGVCQGGSLRKQFYRKSCSQAEQIVKTTIQQHVSSRPELPAKLLRMHFHDCFVRVIEHSKILKNISIYIFSYYDTTQLHHLEFRLINPNYTATCFVATYIIREMVVANANNISGL